MRKVRELESMLPHADPREALGIVLICFGWPILASVEAVLARGAGQLRFSNAALDATLVLELIFGATALAVLSSRRYPLHTLWPRASWRGMLAGLGLFACFVALCHVSRLLMPPEAGWPIEGIMTRTSVSWSSVIPMSIINGAYEEVFLLGYLMRGMRRYGASTAIGIMVLVRMLYHMYQGAAGALAIVLFGIVLGVYYQRKGQLFPVVLAHIAADMAAFLL
jgi:membrane protease YdiL (CAAX protease family)